MLRILHPFKMGMNGYIPMVSGYEQVRTHWYWVCNLPIHSTLPATTFALKSGVHAHHGKATRRSKPKYEKYNSDFFPIKSMPCTITCYGKLNAFSISRPSMDVTVLACCTKRILTRILIHSCPSALTSNSCLGVRSCSRRACLGASVYAIFSRVLL